MRIKIHVLPSRTEARSIDIDKGSTVEQMIRALGLYPDAWIPIKGETPVPLDEVLKDGDEIKLIAVVSGG
jgi:sulfur carrier protein ThiS